MNTIGMQVVASQDWLEMTKYACLVCAQSRRHGMENSSSFWERKYRNDDKIPLKYLVSWKNIGTMNIKLIMMIFLNTFKPFLLINFIYTTQFNPLRDI